jgi:hypothetical protein
VEGDAMNADHPNCIDHSRARFDPESMGKIDVDVDDEEHAHGFELAGAWAFLWAAGTIVLVGLASLVGAAWRAWPWL